MSVPATVTAGRPRDRGALELLDDAGIDATRDAGAFYPQPVGVLVGLPTLVRRGRMAARTFEIPVLVVSGDPLNARARRRPALALADDVALALATDNYRPSSWRSSVNAEPLPAFELAVTVTVPEEEASP